ncbi:MAG TPA: hypothetical protein VEA37_05205, partial [Flavobacterium sp.]|nr:hypothetical protein [Flavobacterium sp.]
HVKDIHVKNAWIKIVHERNVKSRMKGKPVFIKNLSAFRGILPIYLRTSMFNTLGYLVKKIISKLA